MKEEECQLLSWGSLLLLLFVLDLCYTLGEEGVATIIDSRKISEGVSTIYDRRRMLIVVMGVAFPSSPCARPLLCTRVRRTSDHHRWSENW